MASDLKDGGFQGFDFEVDRLAHTAPTDSLMVLADRVSIRLESLMVSGSSKIS
ncbi:hypothetical protein AC519_3153 [Pseudomonas savastanoi]|nr:hypothetical protein AC519_3153 [Pseudomonas savastanoi]